MASQCLTCGAHVLPPSTRCAACEAAVPAPADDGLTERTELPPAPIRLEAVARAPEPFVPPDASAPSIIAADGEATRPISVGDDAAVPQPLADQPTKALESEAHRTPLPPAAPPPAPTPILGVPIADFLAGLNAADRSGPAPLPDPPTGPARPVATPRPEAPEASLVPVAGMVACGLGLVSLIYLFAGS